MRLEVRREVNGGGTGGFGAVPLIRSAAHIFLWYSDQFPTNSDRSMIARWQGWVPNEDFSGKLECMSGGAILVDTPKDAQQFTVIMCAQCKRILGTCGDFQDELLR